MTEEERQVAIDIRELTITLLHSGIPPKALISMYEKDIKALKEYEVESN